MKNHDNSIGIVGGGASGIMAAIIAARNGAQVTILESTGEIGKKILVSGNGRCNFTNKSVTFSNYHGKYPKFAASILSKFDNEKTIEFFESLGILSISDESGRMFPRTEQAAGFLNILKCELKHLGVKIFLNTKVIRVQRVNELFKVEITGGKQLNFDKIILAAGGKSYPKLGSDGSGFSLAKELGHHIETPMPVSVGLNCTREYSSFLNKVQGIKVSAKIRIEDEKHGFHGDLLFTKYGISGWAAMNLSYRLAEFAYAYPLAVYVDLVSEMDSNELISFLSNELRKYPWKQLQVVLEGLINDRLAHNILSMLSVDPGKISSLTSKKELLIIADSLKNLKLEISGVRGWDEAQFTMGGVDVRELNSMTMESKLIPGLYITGEMVDIVGDSGGYNLQWAWSTGFLAGVAATRISMDE